MGKEGWQFSYWIDSEDKIIDVNEELDQFAFENNAKLITSPFIVGTPLENHISDSSTSLLYKQLIAKARSTGKNIDLPFRCDSPAQRRFMTMRIHPESDKRVSFLTRIDKIEDRDPVLLLETNIPASDKFLQQCSWCKRVHIDDNFWVEIEEAVSTLKLMENESLPTISHSICDSCYTIVMKAMDKL